MTDRCSESTFNQPATAKSISQCVWVETKYTGPFRKASCFSIPRQHMVCSSIPRLALPCGPFAVLWAIMAIIVNTFKSMARRWTLPHICKECLKRHRPSFAYSDAAPTVIVVARIVRIAASAAHCVPALVFRRVVHAMLYSSAFTATCTRPISQACPSNNIFRTTVTTTSPMDVMASPFRSWSLRQHQPFMEPLIRQVFEVGAVFDRMSFSHDASPESRVVRMARQHNLSGYSSLYQNQIAL